MKTKTIIFLILVLIIPKAGFSQDLEGKRDGVYKEYYEGEKVKLEYMVKNGKLNGYYEQYDEDGELEYRQFYIEGVFDGTDRTYYYFPLFFWYQHISGEAETVILSEEEALDMFAEDYELAPAPMEGNWMGIVRTRVPVGDDREERHPVTLAGISRNYIYLNEYVDRDDIEPFKHYFYKLVREYKVPRSEDVDILFNVDYITELLQRRHTGIEFGTPFGRWRSREGSRLKSVQQYIGNPDYEYPLKPSGWFDIYYEYQNLRIVGHNFAVYFMEESKPDWAGLPQYRSKRVNSDLERKIRRLKKDQERFLKEDEKEI